MNFSSFYPLVFGNIAGGRNIPHFQYGEIHRLIQGPISSYVGLGSKVLPKIQRLNWSSVLFSSTSRVPKGSEWKKNILTFFFPCFAPKSNSNISQHRRIYHAKQWIIHIHPYPSILGKFKGKSSQPYSKSILGLGYTYFAANCPSSSMWSYNPYIPPEK